MKRFILLILIAILTIPKCVMSQNRKIIMTVNGPVDIQKMGVSLIHEHILVDFIGAEKYSSDRWDDKKVFERSIPFLQKIKELGCQTFVECTGGYLGRDVLLLRALSNASGLNIITNTGNYGAGNNKYIPAYAFTETAEQLANRWIAEWKEGIDSTGIKPGLIKIGVDGGPLSVMHQKLITAAAKAHLQTGLVIASHTGPSVPAFEQIAILQKEGVSPEAFIWVHAQAERDLEAHVKAARLGAWIGLDGVNDSNIQEYVVMIQNLKNNNLLNKVLLSHDAGWYDPAKENGGEFRGYTSIFEKLIPALKEAHFSDAEIHQLLVENPANAFEIRIRKA